MTHVDLYDHIDNLDFIVSSSVLILLILLTGVCLGKIPIFVYKLTLLISVPLVLTFWHRSRVKQLKISKLCPSHPLSIFLISNFHPVLLTITIAIRQMTESGNQVADVDENVQVSEGIKLQECPAYATVAEL